MPISVYGDEKAPVLFRRGFRTTTRFKKPVPKQNRNKFMQDFKKDLMDKLKRTVKNLFMSEDGQTMAAEFDDSKKSMLLDTREDIEHDIDTALHDVESDLPEGETWDIVVEDIPDASMLYAINPRWYSQELQERRPTWGEAFMRVFCCL